MASAKRVARKVNGSESMIAARAEIQPVDQRKTKASGAALNRVPFEAVMLKPRSIVGAECTIEIRDQLVHTFQADRQTQ